MAELKKTKILVVDDDITLLHEVRAHLEKLAYTVTIASEGQSALALARSADFDLVILDINFPDLKATNRRAIDGIEMLRILRDESKVPVIMLSATNVTAVKVMTLTLGADDYVSKPFEMTELGARVQSILRRCGAEAPADRILSFKRLRLDPGERRVWKDGNLIDLTGIEFDILYALARRPEHVFTREKVIELAWKGESFSVPKAVDVHIGHIRKKTEDDPNNPAFIVTVRGTGYRFEDVAV